MFTLNEILIALVVLFNVGSFILVYVDKRKSINNSERVPEVVFFIWSIFLSSLGVLAGMFVFRHKTQKLSFIFGIGLLLLQQLALLYFLLNAVK